MLFSTKTTEFGLQILFFKVNLEWFLSKKTKTKQRNWVYCDVTLWGASSGRMSESKIFFSESNLQTQTWFTSFYIQCELKYLRKLLLLKSVMNKCWKTENERCSGCSSQLANWLHGNTILPVYIMGTVVPKLINKLSSKYKTYK